MNLPHYGPLTFVNAYDLIQSPKVGPSLTSFLLSSKKKVSSFYEMWS